MLFLRIITLTCISMLTGCASFIEVATQPKNTLDHWLNTTFLPQLKQDLLKPRFQNMPIAIVKMQGNEPVYQTDALTLSLKGKISESIGQLQSIHLWREQSLDQQHVRQIKQLQCQPEMHVGHFLGIDIQSDLVSGEDIIRFGVRDAEESNTWVPGMIYTWRGQLTDAQKSAQQSLSQRESYRGLRGLPFSGKDSDKIARYIAFNLGCLLQRPNDGDVHLSVSHQSSGAHSVVDAVLNQLTDNLARFTDVDVTTEPSKATKLVTTSVHLIDPEEQLYRLSAAIKGSEGNLLSGAVTQVYFITDVELPQRHTRVERQNNGETYYLLLPAIEDEPLLDVRESNEYEPHALEPEDNNWKLRPSPVD
jgi:hypothetical protein